jgi:methyltransferase (TIGR00027 family)
MRKNRASSTAKLVALWRALAHDGHTFVPNFSDAQAAPLLTGAFRLSYELARKQLARMPADKRTQVIERFEPVIVRVATIDAELLDAIQNGIRQVVILGAGFDTRAHRFSELSGIKVYEVDHPATQAEKRARMASLPEPKAQVIYTAVDFERDSLSERLAVSGHDGSAPTVWIWEGVVMYLADPAVNATLSAVRALSRPNSRLILQYHEPSTGKRLRLVRNVLLGFAGEPQIGVRTRAHMQSLVQAAGFRVREDLGNAEQAAKVGGRALTLEGNDLARISRILVAEPA